MTIFMGVKKTSNKSPPRAADLRRQIGAEVGRYAGYVSFQLAEAAVRTDQFAGI